MLSKIKNKYIGDRAFYKLIFGVAFPIMIQNGLSNFVSLLDNIMVGQLGTEQMSGVAIINQFIFVYYLMLFGGLSGVGIFTAQYFGKKDDEGIRHTFRYKVWLGFIIAIITALVFLWFGDFLIQKFLNESNDGGDLVATMNYARSYLGIILFMIPGVSIGMMYSTTLRECGETVVPMIASMAAIFINLALNWLLIFGKLGFPEMGVKGAAIATVIAKYTETVILIVWSIRNRLKHTYFNGMFKTLLVPSNLVKKFIITGMPILVNEGLWSIGVTMLAQAYSERGITVVAGQSIANTINNLFNIFFIALGDAVAIIIGQYLGAGDMKKAKDTDNKIIATAVFSSFFIGVILFLTSGLFPRLYNTSELAKVIATHFLMIQAVFMPKDAFLHTSYFTIRAGGKTIITFFFDSFFMMVVSVPVAYILSRYTALGAVYIFAIVHAVDFIKCIVGYILIKKNIWMKNIVKE